MSKFKPQIGSGDNGYTYCIITRHKVPKTHSCIEFVGALDEAEASLGLAQSLLEALEPSLSAEARVLEYMQRTLFRIGFTLAGHNCIGDDDVRRIENYIDKYASDIEPLFVLNGGHPAAAATSFARATIRRAERAYWKCITETNLAPPRRETIAKLLNRLSDLAFLLQIHINKLTNNRTKRATCKEQEHNQIPQS